VRLPDRFDFPELFVSVSCNPRWTEITDAIPANGHWSQHMDIGMDVDYWLFDH